MALKVDDVANDYAGVSRAVLQYCMTTKSLVDAAKRPGFSQDSWAPLAIWSTMTPSSEWATSKK